MFPDFHSSWLTHLKNVLNSGLLPADYYAMAEQRASLYGPDVLTLTSTVQQSTLTTRGENGAVALAEPRAMRKVISHALPSSGRALTIHHASGDRVVAVIEIVSPANKDRPEHVGDFAGKVAALVRNGVHVVVVDILPPGRHDPEGIQAAIWEELDTTPEPTAPPLDQPLTFAGYKADDKPTAYISYSAVGRPLPDVPLFLDMVTYVEVPLEQTYVLNYSALPARLKSMLE
jgi:hypothetical protein